MKLSAGTYLRAKPNAGGETAHRVLDFAMKVEAIGLEGFWVTDSLGRGRPTLDPLVQLGALAAVTKRIELATGVLQVPLRHPVELAHRIQSVSALCGDRLVLGIGSGSTKADFDLLDCDYERRFKTMTESLAIMRQAWRGEPLEGGVLTPWPGTEQGPPVLLGVWRHPRWLAYAAQQCEGWVASGLFSTWDELAEGMRIFREKGGKRAILTNVPVDVQERSEVIEMVGHAKISLVCPKATARERLQRIADLGFDDVVLVSALDDAADLEPVRDLG